MENIILGLLLLQDRTIYQLRKRINAGLNLMYSCSMGSIQAAIKKLLKNEYIIFQEISENGRLKKLYSITSKGKKYFNSWINSPFEKETPKNSELVKIYFMGFTELENRKNLIKNHISYLKIIYSDLDKICQEGEKNPDALKNDIFFYQLQTAKYGRDLILFNINWYTNLLKKEI